jgi:hypothetical protein
VLRYEVSPAYFISLNFGLKTTFYSYFHVAARYFALFFPQLQKPARSGECSNHGDSPIVFLALAEEMGGYPGL